MTIAAVSPIIRLDTPAVRIEGTVSHVDRRGKQLFTFEGTGLRKIGRGDVAMVTHNGSTYRGDLVAISPTRAILHISTSRTDHGVDKID